MNYAIILILFNLNNDEAVVRQEPTMQICEAEKAIALKQMHIHAKDGAQYNAVCTYSNVFIAKRGKA